MNVADTFSAMRPDDVRPLATLHRIAFPGFFLTALGEPFLVQLYRGYLADPTAVTVVARSADRSIRGAVIGTTEPAGFFGRLLKRQWPGLVLASARAVLTRPSSTPRLLRAVRYRGDTPPGVEGALLSSICVEAGARGEGVGGQLVDAWVREVRRRGLQSAFLMTDADDNDAVNGFYGRHGWVLDERYITHEGRLMNRYTISLADL